MLNEKIYTVLKETFLFKSFTNDYIDKLINQNYFNIYNFSKDTIIFLNSTECKELNIIIDGCIELQQNDEYGNTLTLATLTTGNMFGENLLFGKDNLYPVDVVSKTKTTIITINKNKVNELIKENFDFTTAFLELLSNKAQLLNKKIKQMSLKSLRKMLTEFLLTQKEIQKSSTINLNMTKQSLADSLGVQRPSLSRELTKMKNEGLIDYDRKTITILNLE